jgi:hypothetical protein
MQSSIDSFVTSRSLKRVNADYGSDKFVGTKAARLDWAVKLPCTSRSLRWLTYAHQHFALRFAFPPQVPDRNHFSHRDLHLNILTSPGCIIGDNRLSRTLPDLHPCKAELGL